MPTYTNTSCAIATTVHPPAIEYYTIQDISDYIVCYFRFMCSAFLIENAELYQFFLTNGMTVKEFCVKEVDPMGVESDQLQVMERRVFRHCFLLL